MRAAAIAGAAAFCTLGVAAGLVYPRADEARQGGRAMTEAGARAGEAVIVAHGAPSDPAPQQAALEALAAQVAALLPAGWRVAGATLAAEGALEAALEVLAAPLVYPFFMAQGWFTGTALPRRLAAARRAGAARAGAGHAGARQLAPFGHDPGLVGLAARAAAEGAKAAGIAPARATLLLAAHGSAVSRGSAEATTALQAALERRGGFARVAAGYVEEAPYLADAARGLGPAVCLPLFALLAGHVTRDLPDALEAAGFRGPLLAPIGAHAEVPALIAAALQRAAG